MPESKKSLFGRLALKSWTTAVVAQMGCVCARGIRQPASDYFTIGARQPRAETNR